MRVGIVSPYSYTYPGGVGRHIEALSGELSEQGHDVRVLAPYDPDDRLARVMHRGAAPDRRPVPENMISLGRSTGFPANGAVSNLGISSQAVGTLGRELRNGGYDVIHVHEPNAPFVGFFATETAKVPLVSTHHCYSTNGLVNGFTSNVIGVRRLYNKIGVKMAVSQAAQWTAERFYGGRYRVVPNGVDLSRAQPDHGGSDVFELLFVGRADARKGLPILLRAFEALRNAGVPARLTVAGASEDEVRPLLLDPEGVHIAGRVTEDEKWRMLGRADILCAPSLGGESFGMVLTEAFASGTPVVASDIVGYRDVVRRGMDGLLVQPADPAALGEDLRTLALDPVRRADMAVAARERAERFSWPNVAAEVLGAYEDAIELPAPADRRARATRAFGMAAADGLPVVHPKRLPSIEPRPQPTRRRRAGRLARRAGVAAAAVAGVGLAGLAVRHIGPASIGGAMLAATPVWVMVAFALMCLSMLIRAEAWHAILRAALPGVKLRRRDTARGTMIGVFMSATLPARLGEPSRALIVARRAGRVRELLPIVLGTLVSQTLLNLLALGILGGVMFATVGVFRGGEDGLVLVTIAPLVAIVLLLAVPALLRSGKPSRFVRVQHALTAARNAVVQVRQGLGVFRQPRLGAWATVTQLSAWAIQWMSCYALLVALGLDGRAGVGAAAAVLFAVNVTAALPATPSNLGVFQAACVAVLSAYGVGHTDALAYGIILQAVEVATAVTLGMPALLREGMSWKDLRMSALHTTPVELRNAVPRRARDAAEAET